MIFERQYTKVLAQEVLKQMLLGRLPDMNFIASKVSSILGESKITYQYTPQPSRSVFQNEVYNKGLRRIKFDIDTLHEEILELITKASERMTYADLFHKVNSYQLSQLESQLKSLLFTLQNTDFYFLGAYDSFSDTTKLDTVASTEGVIDLSENCVALPYGGKNTQKIKTSHLFNLVDWPISVAGLSSDIISSSLTAGSAFGNMFVDTISAWGYEVISTSNTGSTIQFTFPLAGSAEQEIEVLVNRFELIPHSPSPQTVVVRLSNDGINYFAPLGYENGIELSDQKLTYGMDFETTLVQYVQVTITKHTPDYEAIVNNTKQFTYQFGLRNISALTIGRLSKGRYQSLPFSFKNEEEKISKVSIQASSSIPPGCDIHYSVALSDDTGPTTSFIPITPVSQASVPGSSQVVNFGTTTDNQIKLSIPRIGNDAAQTYGRPFQGKTFYRIGPNITPAPLFKSTSLYRGYNSWYRDTSTAFEMVSVSDIYISFEESDVESLYTWYKEVGQSENLPIVDDLRKIQVRLSKPVYYNASRGHLMKPPAGITNTSSDIKPNYAISKVTLAGASTRRTKSFLLQNPRTQFLPASNYILQSVTESDMPVLQTTSGGQIYRRNIDYILQTEDINGRQVSNGKFTIPDGSAFLNASGSIATPNLLLEFVYTNDPDITYKVSTINDNFVTLSNITVSNDDTIEITYRYIPTSPSVILKPSIRVSNLPTTSGNRTFYVEGRDYNVSTEDGGIQRIPTGSIGIRGSVYIDYTYKDANSGIETFYTWCNIASTSGVQIKLESSSITKKNKLVVDNDVGEVLYVNTPQGLINITNSIVTPVLGPGWVQFVVRSKNPDSYQTFGTNLINQVIQLRDYNNKKIFKSNNVYFKDIVPFRDSMNEITLNHLRVNTLLSNHTAYAIDNTTSVSENYIVLNYLPNTTSELYLYGPTDDIDNTSNPQIINEEYLFLWSSKVDSNLIGSKVIVRIDLERSQESDGSLTPKVFDYKLRASI